MSRICIRPAVFIFWSTVNNHVAFDGQTDITIKSSTTNKLLKGTYLTGADFDGTNETTWSVDATSANTIGKVVARNSEGGFSAGTISATFVGDLTGNVLGNVTGDLTGNVTGTASGNLVSGGALAASGFSAESVDE